MSVVAAQAAEGSVFDHTQQFGLRFDAESRDFVENNRSLGGEFQLAEFPGIRTREGALLVAE